MNTHNVAFSSASRYEHVAVKGHVNIFASGIANEKTITHNLGYVPFFRLFVLYPGRSFYEPLVQSPIDQGAYIDYQVFTDIIDANKITVAYLNNTANPDPTILVYYRIYAEPQS